MRKKKISKIDYVKLYKEVFGTEQGQLVLADLCRKFYIFRPTKLPKGAPGDMEHCEGMRNVVLFILSQVEYDLNTLLENRQDYSLEITNE